MKYNRITVYALWFLCIITTSSYPGIGAKKAMLIAKMREECSKKEGNASYKLLPVLMMISSLDEGKKIERILLKMRLYFPICVRQISKKVLLWA